MGKRRGQARRIGFSRPHGRPELLCIAAGSDLPQKKGVLRGSGFAAAPQTPLTPSSLPPQASGGGERHGSNINRDCKSMACTAERLEWKMF